MAPPSSFPLFLVPHQFHYVPSEHLPFSEMSKLRKLQKITTQEYIDKYKTIAIAEMHRTGIPASITLAQGLLESASGNSMLAQKAKNHFGIKCHSSWKGPKIFKDDDKKHECFRKYPVIPPLSAVKISR